MALSRREFLTTSILLPLFLFNRRFPRAQAQSRQGATYHVDAGVFFGLFTFNVDGSIQEQIDRAAGRYRVVVAGQGSQITNRLESTGIIRGRRFVPSATNIFLDLRGRELISGRDSLRKEKSQALLQTGLAALTGLGLLGGIGFVIRKVSARLA